MQRFFVVRCAYALLCVAVALALAQTPFAQLHHDFVTPPAEARPLVRWWWFGPAVTRPEILHELQQMKADGIGGAELAFVYPLTLDQPARGVENLRFVSTPMLDMVRYAQQQGRALGLRIDVTLCSGWPYGGPHISLELAAERLRTVEVSVPAGATTVAVPQPPNAGDTFLSASLVSGTPGHWTSVAATSLEVAYGAPSIEIPQGSTNRVALFFFAGHTRQMVKRAAVGAEGYVLDPFSRKAVDTHLQAIGKPLLSAFGQTPPYAIFSDSLETYGADWTPALPAEFQKRRGYALLPLLPALVAGDTPEARNVRHDWGVTLTELVNENYLTEIDSWAKAHGTRFRSQTYGEPAVSFSSQALVSLAEGEGSQWRQFSTLRWAASANHVFSRNVTSGETFTWLDSPVFRATPLDMKAETDVDFLSGENLLVFHGWPYSPDRAGMVPPGDPGWSLYAAAALNDHNPWHPVMPTVTAYIARMSYLLRQGEPANQVAVLLPTDDAWTGFVPGKVTVTGAMTKLVSPELMDAILSAGYNVDFIDADAVQRVGLAHYSAVVLPPTDRIPVATLHSLGDFARNGGHAFAVGSLPAHDATGAPLTDQPLLHTALTLVSAPRLLGEALQHAVTPDMHWIEAQGDAARAVGFIRRKLADADIYFVANTSNRAVNGTVAFATQHTEGEHWSTDTGEVVDQVNAARLSLSLPPYGSAVFVFGIVPASHTPAVSSDAHTLADLSQNWTVRFVTLDHSEKEPSLADWTADPATLHYSGEAVYTREVSLPRLPAQNVWLHVEGGEAVAPTADAQHPATLGADGLPNPLVTRPGPGMRAWYAPPIREAALVYINGHAAGALWHPPYALDVTPWLHAGTNKIEIRVFNTALNAWSALPPRDDTTLKAKYGDRFQMQDTDKIKPLSSGILGHIELVEGDLR